MLARAAHAQHDSAATVTNPVSTARAQLRPRRPSGAPVARAGCSSRRRSRSSSSSSSCRSARRCVLSVTDFDLYAIANPSNARFVGPRNYTRPAPDPDLLERAQEHLLLRARRRPAHHRRLARRRAAGQREAGALQELLPHRLLHAVRHDARRGRDRLALPVPPALRPAQLRASAHVGIGPIDWLGDPHWAMPAIILHGGVEELRLQHADLHRRAAGDSRGALRRGARSTAPGPCGSSGSVTLPMLAPTLLLRRRHHDDRLLPALRRAVRDDAGRPAAQHDERRAAHVRGGLPLVADGLRGGDRVRAVRRDPACDADPAPARSRRLRAA